MKILVLNTLYPPSQVGGAEKSVALLSEALAARGHEVMAVSLHPGSLKLEETVNGVQVIRLRLDNLYWPFTQGARPSALRRLLWHVIDMLNLRAARRVGAIIDAFRPDVIHTNNIQGFSGQVWREARRRSVPIVHTLRDYSLLCSRATLFKKGRNCTGQCRSCALLTTTKKVQCGLADVVVSNSHYVLDRHLAAGYFTRTEDRRVIFNIADLAASPVPPDTDRAEIVFGYIGRVEPEKGVEVVLEAAMRMRETTWRLKVAGLGAPDYVARLQARFSDPRIEWLGHVKSDVFYQAVDVVLISSVWPEPLPRTLIESMALGKPTICAKAGGIPEIAQVNGESRLYEPDDAPGLARIMDEAVANGALWRRLFPMNPAFAARFSPQAVSEAYLDAYRRAISLSAGR